MNTNAAPPQIPNGIKLMMKTFGIDPEAMTATIGESVRAFTAKVDELQATETRILQRVEVNHTLLNLLHDRLSRIVDAPNGAELKQKLRDSVASMGGEVGVIENALERLTENAGDNSNGSAA